MNQTDEKNQAYPHVDRSIVFLLLCLGGLQVVLLLGMVRKNHFWQDALPFLGIATVALIGIVVAVLVKTQTVEIADLTHIGIHKRHTRSGLLSHMEFASPAQKWSVSVTQLDSSDLIRLVRALHSINPDIQFDEDTKLLSQGRTMPPRTKSGTPQGAPLR